MINGQSIGGPAHFIKRPQDADLLRLYNYWNTARGNRMLPRREDIDPSAIPKLLPHVFMYEVTADGGYSIRLAGEELVSFIGYNPRGQAAGSTMTSAGATGIVAVLDVVVGERAPKFRAGQAYWRPKATFRRFEGCFLPLSADGRDVNMVLGGLKFGNAA
jgi:hypothetical protein